MQRTIDTKSGKNLSDNENSFVEEDLSTASDDNTFELPESVAAKIPETIAEITNAYEQPLTVLPEVSAKILELVEFGPNNKFFKQIYGLGDKEELDKRKRIFVAAYELWKKEHEESEPARTEFRDRVLQEDYEVTRNINATLKKAKEADAKI